MAPTKKPASKAVGAVPRKKKANGYQMPVKIPNGEILTDVCKKQWKIGKSIGVGGFGEIYLAATIDKTAPADYKYVVKIEPHANGPLFVESHFYKRVAKSDEIEKYRKQRGLKTFGMPNLIASGSHDLNNIKHRFIVIPRYGQNIWNIFLENNRKLPQHTVYRIAIQMIDILQYIHGHAYVHMDIKGANILLGLEKATMGQAYLVDFGLACHYTTKDFKPDPKKMHDGTIEYTSRDAHLGIPTMRGDMEVLAFNILHWSGGTLPWELEKLLDNPKKVQESKETFMNSIDKSLRISFSSLQSDETIGKYFKYVSELKYDQAPDYDKCRKILLDGLKTLGKSNVGDFDFKIVKNVVAAPVAADKNKGTKVPAPKKKTVRARSPPPKMPSIEISDSDDEHDEEPVAGPSNRKTTKVPRKRTVVDDLSPSSFSPAKKSKNRQPPSSKAAASSSNTVAVSQRSTPGTFTVVSTPSKDGKKSNKNYQLNLELNVSIDANVVVNVRRKDKKEKKPKEALTSTPPTAKNGHHVDYNDDDDDDEVIPDSRENTPIAKVRIAKKTNGNAPSRRSPRAAK